MFFFFVSFCAFLRQFGFLRLPPFCGNSDFSVLRPYLRPSRKNYGAEFNSKLNSFFPALTVALNGEVSAFV